MKTKEYLRWMENKLIRLYLQKLLLISKKVNCLPNNTIIELFLDFYLEKT